MFNQGDYMSKELKSITTETLNAAANDLRELEVRLGEIFDQFGGINIRSITRLIHDFGTQIEVNGDLYWEGSLYADSPDFHWDGDPAKVKSLRLLEYKHLAYIYIATKTPEHPHYIDYFDIGFEMDERSDEWASGLTAAVLVEELKSRLVVPSEIVKTATKMFNDLRNFLTENNFSLCYDEDNASVFVGPKNLLWNVGSDGNIPAENLRKFATHELMEAFSEQGHIASECITHVHPSDSDETFRYCNLTYAV
jgi:hypothetical protein